MSVQGWIALATLVAAAVAFLRKWLPLEVIALSVPVVLQLTGVLDARDAFQGFASDAVIAIAAVFVLGGGLQESGVTTLLARLLQRMGSGSETRIVLGVMVVAAAVSAFMPNAAAVAILLPAVVVLSRRTRVPASRLLIPLAFGAVLGGNLTLLGATPNLLVSEEAERVTGSALGMFDFLPIGLAMAAAGTGFMVLFGRKLLPVHTTEDRLRDALLPETAARLHGLTKTLYHMRVVPKSRIVGRTIADAGIRSKHGLHVLAIERPRRVGALFLEPRPDIVLASGDELYLEGDDEAAWRFADDELVQYGLAGPADIERILARGLTLAEVTVPPRSEAVGRTLRDLAFRARFGLNVLSLWRKGVTHREDVADTPIELGDAFLVSGKAQRVRELARDPEFIVLTGHEFAENVSRAPLALVLVLAAVLPPAFGLAPASVSALLAALLMVGTGCLSVPQALRAIDFKVLFLIIGMMPIGVALDRHGVAAIVASGVLGMTGSLGGAAVLAALFLMAALLSIGTTNSTAAVVIAPIAVKAAQAGGVDAKVALLAVAYGCSCAFMLPSHQCNLQVTGPGGYRARDFVVSGLWMTLVVCLVAIVLLGFLA